jgi:hypothetical protein
VLQYRALPHQRRKRVFNQQRRPCT